MTKIVEKYQNSINSIKSVSKKLNQYAFAILNAKIKKNIWNSTFDQEVISRRLDHLKLIFKICIAFV